MGGDGFAFIDVNQRRTPAHLIWVNAANAPLSQKQPVGRGRAF